MESKKKPLWDHVQPEEDLVLMLKVGDDCGRTRCYSCCG